MAENASTGNNGTGTASTSTTGASSISTTSNGGPVSSGSQASSNGSFSTGNNGNGGSNINVGPGLPFGAGVTSNSNGNFSGGLPGFIGHAAINAVQGWGGRSGGSSTNSTKTEPVMTVDEVYGKGNQPIVESQGDYEASSNEKSNVETSTFGKQDEISVTPVSVTKDEGLVNNNAIQSVEGLDFQQKDKANQEVMEAKKSRDEAEAEDNADGMRDRLKAVTAKAKAEEDNNAFQVGEKNTFEEQNKAKLAELNNLKNDLNETNKAIEEVKNAKTEADKKVEEAKLKLSGLKDKEAEEMESVTDLELQAKNIRNMNVIQKTMMNMSKDPMLEALKSNVMEKAKQYGVDVPGYQDVDSIADAIDNVAPAIKNSWTQKVAEAENKLTIAQKQQEDLEANQNTLMSKAKDLESKYTKAQEDYKTFKAEYWTNAENTKAEEEAAAKAKAEEAPTYKGTIAAAKDEINNSKDLTDEQKAAALTVVGNVESAADDMNKAANNLAKNPNDPNAVQLYMEATAKYEKTLEDAKGDKTLENTDCNRTFVKVVAGANDFPVTWTDGAVQNYAEFAAEMAVRSPELAKAMYEAKAKKLEAEGHKVLAAIEKAKSKMVMTWLGSKFTFADNQVRSQFNQMAKTDMRATYAAYNNVLNDETGKYSEADKAEASAARNQANSLMTASAALQASTGFLSGIGDGTSDGVYGTTDPGKLNGYQKTLNTASNFAKVTLGLGVTPGANKAYQNMYYMAGAKVNESGLFSKDFDGDGFALCQEYGNNAAVGMIVGAGELGTGVALMFNPATSKLGLNLAIDAVQTFFDGLYGVQKDVNKSIKYSNEVLSYFNEAKDIVAETGNKEAISTMDSAIKQIEDFQLKSDEVGNLDNWLEGSGSNTVDNGKFNQALSYDEWLKLIEADPVMREYAKSLNR